MSSLLRFLGVHTHDWGIWHKENDKLVMTCYGCGRTKTIKVKLED